MAGSMIPPQKRKIRHSLSTSTTTQPDFLSWLSMGWLWLARPFLAQRDRWALLLPLPLAGGIWLWFSRSEQPDWWLAGFFLVTTVAVWRVLSASDIWRWPALLLVWAALGFAAAEWRAYMVDAPVLENRIRFAKLEGQVDSVHPRRGGYQVVLSRLLIAGQEADAIPGRVRVTLRDKNLTWQPGDRVRLNARLFPPSRPVMPGAWDYGRQLWFDRINATGFAFGSGTLLRRDGPPGLRGHIALWRQRVSQALLDVFDQTGAKHGALAVALLTGERGLLSDDIRDDMRGAGLAHLLAISGLHIGLVSGMIYLTVRGMLALAPAIVLRWPIRKWAAIAGWLSALFYWQLSGATIPTERAFIMVSVFFLAILIDRQALSMRNVMIAAVLVLLFRPEAMFSAGFHLSFAATAALIASVEIWQDRRRRSGKDASFSVRAVVAILRYPAGVAATSLIAGLATGPLAAFHFGQIAWYGLLANMLAVPLVGLMVMPVAIVVLLLLPFGLAELVVPVLDMALGLVLEIASRVAALPRAVSQTVSQSLWVPLLFGAGLLWLAVWRNRLRMVAVIWFGLSFLAGHFIIPDRPDLVVSEDGKTIFLNSQPPAAWSKGRPDDWLLSRWGQSYGLRSHNMVDLATWAEDRPPSNGATGLTSWRCDEKGCSGKLHDYVIALAHHPSALALDCQKADILIATIPVRRACRNPMIMIDRFDLWRYGSHAITFTTVPRVTRATNPDGQNRPWRPVPKR